MKKFIIGNNAIRKIIFLSVFSLLSSNALAGLPEMMQIYTNPKSAPQIKACKGNTNCNAFTALAKQWQAIPKNYRYHGFNIRRDAAIGDGYGLNKGFVLNKERSQELVGDYDNSTSAYSIYYNGGSKPKTHERIFAQGLAVLLYIEDKNGWSR